MTYKQKYLKHRGYAEQDYILCESCFKKRANDVHHIHFKSKGGTDRMDNLIAVCRDCHIKAHEGILIEAHFKELKRKQFNY